MEVDDTMRLVLCSQCAIFDCTIYVRIPHRVDKKLEMEANQAYGPAPSRQPPALEESYIYVNH